MDELEKTEIPAPKLGGTFVYCPYVTAETIKKPKKKAVIVTTPCKFRTRNISKYRRHWIARHGQH